MEAPGTFKYDMEAAGALQKEAPGTLIDFTRKMETLALIFI